MPTEQNPYEAIPSEPATKSADRRKLTGGETLAAIALTLIASGLTLFVTCLGVIGFADAIEIPGRSLHGNPRTPNEPVHTLVLFILYFGVPTLMAAIVGGLTLKSCIRAGTTVPPSDTKGFPDAPGDFTKAVDAADPQNG